MSYLKEASADESVEGKTLPSAIISFWIMTSSQGPEDKWQKDWLPQAITELIDNDNVMYSGGNYWTGINGESTILQPPHLWAWPPGTAEALGADNLRTFKDGMHPFISWGERHAKYKRVKWEKKVLRSDYWVFGRGGKANNLISQYPAPAGDAEGIVPPSCIGVNKETGKLRIILQTKSHAKYKGYAYTMAKAKCVFILTPLLPVGGFGNAKGWKDFAEGNPLNGAQVGNAIWYDDVSQLEFGQHPESFVMDCDDRIADGNWHHICLAFDFTSSSCSVKGDGEKAYPPHPGTYGQYSGPNGDIALNPATGDPKTSGAPFEDCGTGTGPCIRGIISSSLKAWVYVDGKKKEGRELHFAPVWNMIKNRIGSSGEEQPHPLNIDLSALEGTDNVVPVNALVALTGDPRLQIVTSQTAWEREYRTFFGKFLGPACKIDVTDEPRRFSYDVPEYTMSECVIPRAKFTIPAGEVWNDLKWNLDCKIAELFIWTDKGQDPSSFINVLIKDGKPGDVSVIEDMLGVPNVKLHFSANWKVGFNTGTDGIRGVGAGQQQEKELLPEGQYAATGKIERWMPDPKIASEGDS